ncbi:MAG: penicillin-binding protein activator [Tissierellia bacterium]|nr:penicillin-binding protein activator [Tissierellia bacterium]
MKRLLFPLTLLLILLLGACSGLEGMVHPREERPEISMGVFSPLTGDMSDEGQSFGRGVQLAHNQRRYLGDEPIGLVFYDTKSNSFDTANAVAHLTQTEKVQGLLSTIQIGDAMAAISAAGIPTLTAATDGKREGGDFITPLGFNNEQQARAMAQYAERDLNLSHIAILTNEESDYSQELGYHFASALSSGVKAEVLEYHSGETLFRPEMRRLQKMGVDGVYIADRSTTAAYLVRALHEKLPYITVLGSDRMDSANFVALGGDAAENVYYSTNFHSGKLTTQEAANFVQSYRKAYGMDPNAQAALGFDSYNLLWTAMSRQEEPGPIHLQHALGKLDQVSLVSGVYYRDPQAPQPVHIVQIQRGIPRYRKDIVVTAHPQP